MANRTRSGEKSANKQKPISTWTFSKTYQFLIDFLAFVFTSQWKYALFLRDCAECICVCMCVREFPFSSPTFLISVHSLCSEKMALLEMPQGMGIWWINWNRRISWYISTIELKIEIDVGSQRKEEKEEKLEVNKAAAASRVEAVSLSIAVFRTIHTHTQTH